MEGIYPDNIKEHIKYCIRIRQPIKIMVTYDSLYKVLEALGNKIAGYRIVVDEYQEILKAYSYRDKAIRKMLKDLQGHKKITYISATPVPIDDIPELAHLDRYRIDWVKTERCKPIRKKTNKPLLAARNMILAHKAGNGFMIDEIQAREYYFFVNSVRNTASIINAAGLTNDEVKVICADSPENKKH